MNSHFYALLSRMKYINRWGLMHSSRSENLSEHTADTSIITHALISIHNEYFGGNLSAGDAVLYALYHDCSEILTGDMPTPVKYYNKEIENVFKNIEHEANKTLLSLLPEALQTHYKPFLLENSEVYSPYVKAADKICALIKCIEEKKLGNEEFEDAYNSTLGAIKRMNLDEANYFLEHFLPSYSLTLDKLKL